MRRFIFSVMASLAAGSALAQTGFPNKPVRLIISFAAGGPADVVARLLAEKLGPELGQSVVVENRTGGNSVIGTNAVARADPDGHTIGMITAANIIVTHLQKDIPFDFDRDVGMIGGIGAVPNVLVVAAKTGIRAVADIATHARSMPGGLNYASGGNGSLGHLAAAMLMQDLRIQATHLPYRGNSLAIQDLIANRVQVMFSTIIEGTAASKTGEVRMLGVAADKRLPIAPDLPTFKEIGLGHIDPRTWYGMIAPAKTPPAIVERLQAAIAKAVMREDMQERLKTFSFETHLTTGAQLREFVRGESARWQKVIRDNDIKTDTQ